MFNFLFKKYPFQYTIISVVVTIVLTIIGLIVYFFYFFKKNSVKMKPNEEYLQGNNDIELETKRDICVDMILNKKEDSEEADSLKTTKSKLQIGHVDSKYLRNLNQDTATFTKYLHKSNKPFIGY